MSINKLDRTLLKDLHDKLNEQEIVVCGWIRNLRNSKSIAFIELNDGTCFNSTQIVVEDAKCANYAEIISLNIGASIVVKGIVALTPNALQPFEIKAVAIEVEGVSTPDYPLQNKKHSMEFLREIAHLRPRTNTFSAVFRVRSMLTHAIHDFFYERGFVYVNTPIITGSDCEGAGEMFRVTTLEDTKNTDESKDFFLKKTGLTVSGQLAAESFAMAFSNVYTFGPTFRAEDSHTTRHSSEFWMLEPEMAFCDLEGDMKIAEDMIKYVINVVLSMCSEEMKFFNKFIDTSLIQRLKSVATSEFVKITYTEAVEMLEKYNDKFEYKVSWGSDLQTEHERFLTEQLYQKPVFVTDYPKDIKAFYMKLNEDGKTVRAVDMLVPGIGEILGGSQREDNLEKLEKAMLKMGMNTKEYEWYLDTRRYGTCQHSGFGLGFERLIMYITGMTNIRDVLPFPRTPGNCLY
ncbi:MAG: asparagine--tRNA ligase [Clostridia bacterium]